MNRRGLRSAVPAGGTAAAAVLRPGAAGGEWELCRGAVAAHTAGSGDEKAAVAATRQTFASLEAAAANVQPAEAFVLALPMDSGLVQRLTLPAAEPAELEEMARIQLEKILPFPAETVGIALQEIARTPTEVTVAVETVHYDRLLRLCQPLTARGCWPRQVIFHALALAAAAPADENTALLYREAGGYVLGICEGGRLSFAQALGGRTAEQLAGELPAVLLGAELEGVPGAFSLIRLDEGATEWRETLAAALNVPVQLFDPAAAALAVAAGGVTGDLSPPGWRTERVKRARAERVRRQLLTGAGLYLGLLVLGFAWLGVLRWQLQRLNSRLDALRPRVAFADEGAHRWKTLAPALDPTRSTAETLLRIYQCLPPGDIVRLTAFEQTPRTLSVEGEAPTAAAAVDFTEKVKASRDLKSYRFDDSTPAILPNNHAHFRVTGTIQ